MAYIIRTSDRQFFKRCRQLWDFTSKIRQDYEPLASPAAPRFGTAIHAALEAYYNPETWDDNQLKCTNAETAFIQSINEWKGEGLRLTGSLAVEVERDFDERMELGLGMLDGYFAWAPRNIDDEFTPLYTEIEFEVPVIVPEYLRGMSHYLPEYFTCLKQPGRGGLVHWHLQYMDEPVIYQGRIDLVGEYKNRSGYIVRDHKTTAQFGATDFLALDEQCTSYGWALRHMLGLDVTEIQYSQLRKKAPKKPRKLQDGRFSVNKQQDTTYELFMRAIEEAGQSPDDYTEMLQYLWDNPKEFFRCITVRKTEHEYNKQTERIFLEAIDMLNNPSIYANPSPMNCNGCWFYQPCLATQDGGDAKYFLNELYRKRSDDKAGSVNQ